MFLVSEGIGIGNRNSFCKIEVGIGNDFLILNPTRTP